MGAYVMTSEN
jgi:hypothetical protein